MAKQERQRRRKIARWVESGPELERTMYFSDAVFAIAITLLVLDLRLPEVSEEQLKTELPSLVLGLGPKFLSFVITFLVIGFYWLAHHRMFRYINRYDGRLLWMNILFLMSVAFLPFPTSVFSQESTTLSFDEASTSVQILLFTGGSSGSQQFAVAFYAGSAAVSGLLLSWLWWYAARERRLVVDYLAPRLISFFFLRALVPSLIFMLSIGISLISPDAATFSWLLIPISLSILSRTQFRRET